MFAIGIICTVNDLINARGEGLFNFRGLSGGVLIDKRRLKERGVYSHNCNKLKKTNTVCFLQKYQES